MSDDQPQSDDIAALKHTLRHQAESISELRQDVRRLLEWLTALDFNDQGVFAPGETPPILRLLLDIQNENRTIIARTEHIIDQNALLVGDPLPDEAAAFSDAQARGTVSLPALLLQMASAVRTIQEIRFAVRGVAIGLALTLFILAAHHWYLVDRFSSALGWLAALLR